MALGVPSRKISQTVHLKEAVENGDIEIAEKYLKSHNISYITLNNALRTASLNGNFEMVKLLVEHGSSIVTSKNMPIICAASNGHINIVKYFLENGADCTDRSNLAIRKAAKNGHIEMVKLLVENNADCTDFNNEAIILASRNGHTEVTKLLIENGANADANNQQAISFAIENGHLDTVKVLLKAITFFPFHKHEKSINIAARNGDAETIKFFLDKIPDTSFSLLFSSACESGNIELVRYLFEYIEKHLDKSTCNIFQFNSLQRAVCYGRLDIVNFLLEQDYNFSSELDESLAYAAENGNLEIMTLLTEKGANCNATFGPHKSLNAIKLATENNHIEAVVFLINNGAAKIAKQKVKLIEIAAEKGHIDIVEFLLNRVKKVNLNMAIKYATQHEHNEIAKLLIRHTLIHTSRDFDAQIEMIAKLAHDIIKKY